MNAPLNGNGNGGGRILWWIISTLTGLVLGVGGGTLATTSAALRQHAERLAALETQQENDGKRLERIDRNVEQLLRKLP